MEGESTAPAGRGSCQRALTAFVEPPSTFTIAMAFRKELRVRMSLRYCSSVFQS